MQTLIELYGYREMLWTSVKKELRAKYKGSFLGFFWSFLNPLLQLLVYTFFFTVILPSNIPQFYIYLFVGLVPWLFFASSVQGGATCVVAQSNLIKKIYFPRIIIPISFVTAQFVNMLLSFIVIFVVLIVSGFGIAIQPLICLPIVFVAEYLLALGVGIFFAAVTVYIRDLEFVSGIIMMVWMYWTPIFYQIDALPEQYLPLFQVNPMYLITYAYREILYYKRMPSLVLLLGTILLGAVILILSCALFLKLQKRFVEEL